MSEEKKFIAPISEADGNAIKQKSAWALPNVPADKGFTAEMVKGYFWKPLIQGEASLVGHINRIVEEANEALGGRDRALSNLEEKIGSLKNLMRFRGVAASTDEVREPENGDVCIVGDKEYAYSESEGWVEFGDCSANSAALEGLGLRVAEMASELAAREERLQVLEQFQKDVGSIDSLMNFRGVFDATDVVENPANGDVCIVGDKEYAYSEDGGWVEFGDCSANSATLEELGERMTTVEDEFVSIAAALDAILSMQQELIGGNEGVT